MTKEMNAYIWENADKFMSKHRAERESMNQINHPKHYNTGKIEVIEFIEDQNLGYHRGNAVKYICRAGRKDPAKTNEDIKKAVWYLDRSIEIAQEKPRRPNDMNPRSEMNTASFKASDILDPVEGSLKFKLPEEQTEYEQAQKAGAAFAVLDEMRKYLLSKKFYMETTRLNDLCKRYKIEL